MSNVVLFYFVAQIIERFLELLDWIVSFFLPSKGDNVEDIKRYKMIGMWVFATVVAFGFSVWLDLNMLSRLDVHVNVWVDKFLTAVAIGSGTKPIHDMLSLLSRSRG